ncbi:hypothetical protein QUC31_004748 [Theobroma cacao]
MRWNTLSAYRLNASCLHVRRPASQFLEVCPEERNICLDYSGSLREQTIRGGVCIPSHAKYLCKETAKIRCPTNVNGFQPRGPLKFGSFSPIGQPTIQQYRWVLSQENPNEGAIRSCV